MISQLREQIQNSSLAKISPKQSLPSNNNNNQVEPIKQQKKRTNKVTPAENPVVKGYSNVLCLIKKLFNQSKNKRNIELIESNYAASKIALESEQALQKLNNNFGAITQEDAEKISKLEKEITKVLNQFSELISELKNTPTDFCAELKEFFDKRIDEIFSNNKVSYEEYKSCNESSQKMLSWFTGEQLEKMKTHCGNNSTNKEHLKRVRDRAVDILEKIIGKERIEEIAELIEDPNLPPKERKIIQEVWGLYQKSINKIAQKTEEAEKWIDEIYTE